MNRLLAVVALVALTAAPALADPAGDVKSALVALARATSYHSTMTTPSGQTMSGDFVSPGKMHVTAGPMEIIVIDPTTYVKIQGTWRQFTMPGIDRLMGPLAVAQRLAATHDGLVVTDLGPKTVGGATLHAYAVKSSGNPKPLTVYINGGGMPVRVESVDADGTSVVTFSNFDAPITIVAPV